MITSFMFRSVIRQLPIGWAGKLALQRLLSQWRSLLTIIVGVLLSAVVGALVPLYTTAVAQVGMVERFNQIPIEQAHAAANISLIASADQNFSDTIQRYDTQFRQIVDTQLAQRFAGWVNRTALYGETDPLEIDLPTSDSASTPTSRARVAYYEGWQDVVHLVAGRLPKDSPETSDTVQPDIEIVIPFEAQQILGIKLGDMLTLDQGGPTGGWPTSKNVLALVVGIANPPDEMTPVQRGYFMPPSPLRVESSSSYAAQFSALTTRSAFERIAKEFIPDTPTRIGWRVIFDHSRLPFSQSPTARQALFDFNTELTNVFSRRVNADLQFNYSTGLIDWQLQGGQNVDKGAMLAYEQSVRSLNAPFGLLLLQVGALVIFFLLVTAALVRRGERRELAMLQSRGATEQQLTAIRGIEALIICVLMALLAPFVAQQLLIAITPFFANYNGLPLQVSSAAFGYAAVAASAAFIVLMATLRPVLRQPLITSGGSTQRGEHQAWWQRYYVDVLLVVLGIAALWRLAGRDTPLFTTSAGGRTTDPFLLLAPALLFLGLGSILLRLFPLIAATAARLISAGRGLVGSLATWQLSREPVHYGRITFLLALAIGIGWFATSFRATVNRSQTDQAQYAVGTDVRFSERDMRFNVARARNESAYANTQGVEAASVVWRQANINMQGDPAKPPVYAQLLAVDSQTFRNVYRWRPDLGNVQLPDESKTPLPERGEALPAIPEKFHLWANFSVQAFTFRVPDLDRLRNRMTLWARLLDANGTWIKVPFKIIELEYQSTGPQSAGVGGGGSFRTTGWAYLEADVAIQLATQNYQLAAPVRLVSLYWQHRGRNNGERNLQLTLAGLSEDHDSGQRTSLNLFESGAWAFDYDSGAFSEGNVSSGYDDAQHGRGLVANWDQSAEVATLGAVLNYPIIDTLPLIGSNSLAGQLSLQRGQTLNVIGLQQRNIKFQISGWQQYFPTLYDAFVRDGRWVTDDRDRPFVIVDRDRLLYALNRRASATLYADEVWIKTVAGVDDAALLQQLHPKDYNAVFVNVQTINGERANLQTDPLSLGLLGLMFLAFIIAMSLSVVGLLTYAALTAAARRSEFGVLRALGLSPLRLVAQLAFEQIFVIVLGVGLGGLLGAVLSTQVVPRLAQDASSKSITPPFIVQVEAAALVQYGALIVVVLAIVLLFVLVLVRQLSLSRSLRLGEE
jgi:hypothetical protein